MRILCRSIALGVGCKVAEIAHLYVILISLTMPSLGLYIHHVYMFENSRNYNIWYWDVLLSVWTNVAYLLMCLAGS